MMNSHWFYPFLVAALAADNVVCTSLDECPQLLLLQMEATKITNGHAGSVWADEPTWKDRLASLLAGKRTRRGKNSHALLAHFRKRFEITELRQRSSSYTHRLPNSTNASTRVDEASYVAEAGVDLFTTVFMNVVDCAWLFPFLGNKIYWKQNCLVFLVIQMVFAALSVWMAFLEIDLTSGSSSALLLDILTYAAPISLTVIALYLYVTDFKLSHKDGADDHGKENAEAFSTSAFAVILTFSNLDVFAVYVPIIYDEIAYPTTLVGGVALLSVFIMILCLVFSESVWLVEKCEQIPPWGICSIVATASWVGFFV